MRDNLLYALTLLLLVVNGCAVLQEGMVLSDNNQHSPQKTDRGKGASGLRYRLNGGKSTIPE